MSLTSTLSTALSGLSATSGAARIVSSNLANALNENYGRRELEISSADQQFSGGVRILGVSRHVNPALLSDMRGAHAKTNLHSQSTSTLESLEKAIGNVDEIGSISDSFRKLEAALGFAESNPSDMNRLGDVLRNAQNVALTFGQAQSQIQNVRESADTAIRTAVGVINASLQQIEDLNRSIVEATVNGKDTSGYQDQRQQLINTVNEFVPLREMPRSHGAVSLVTQKGVLLLEQSASSISFERTPTIMPHMTSQSGDLSSLSFGGIEHAPDSPNDGFSGGRLEALFAARDQVATAAQSDLDNLAFELASRFEDPSFDPTRMPTDPGLFTDGGGVLDPLDVTGLAGRLSVNSNVNPSEGGELWRLRDGMSAVAPGPAGNASVLSGMLGALTTPQAAISPAFTGTGTMSNFAADIASGIATQLLFAEQKAAFSETQYSEMQEMLFADGVDTDAELQRLMEIETNYAANAKVIETVESMLDSLLRIG